MFLESSSTFALNLASHPGPTYSTLDGILKKKNGLVRELDLAFASGESVWFPTGIRPRPGPNRILSGLWRLWQ